MHAAVGLGQVTFVKDNIELILIGIIAVSMIPIAIELLRARSRARRSPYRLTVGQPPSGSRR